MHVIYIIITHTCFAQHAIHSLCASVKSRKRVHQRRPPCHPPAAPASPAAAHAYAVFTGRCQVQLLGPAERGRARRRRPHGWKPRAAHPIAVKRRLRGGQSAEGLGSQRFTALHAEGRGQHGRGTEAEEPHGRAYPTFCRSPAQRRCPMLTPGNFPGAQRKPVARGLEGGTVLFWTKSCPLPVPTVKP